MAYRKKSTRGRQGGHRPQTNPAAHTAVPDDALPIGGLKFGGDLSKPENAFPFICQTLVHQFGEVAETKNLAKQILTDKDPDVARSNSAAARGVIVRYWLGTDDDVKRIKEMGTQRIDQCFEEAGELWTNIISNKCKGKILKLRLISPEFEDQVWGRGSEIANILGLSQLCLVRSDEYLMEALHFTFTSESLSKPELHIVRWSRNIGVKIMRVFWKSGHLLLSIAYQDAMNIMAGDRKACLNGEEGKISPFDLKSIPYWCFRCAQPGHMQIHGCENVPQCGRCSGPHESRGCVLTPVKCPVCNNVGHEAWNKKCLNKTTLAMRDVCDDIYHRGPMWWVLSQPGQPAQDSGRKHPGRKDSGQEDSGQKDSGRKDSGQMSLRPYLQDKQVPSETLSNSSEPRQPHPGVPYNAPLACSPTNHLVTGAGSRPGTGTAVTFTCSSSIDRLSPSNDKAPRTGFPRQASLRPYLSRNSSQRGEEVEEEEEGQWEDEGEEKEKEEMEEEQEEEEDAGIEESIMPDPKEDDSTESNQTEDVDMIDPDGCSESSMAS